jgi:hypothetical protein
MPAAAQSVSNIAITAGTAADYVGQRLNNGAGNLYLAIDNSAGALGAGAYTGMVWMAGNNPLAFGTNNTSRMLIGATGDILFGSGIYVNNTLTLDTDNRIFIGSTGGGSDVLYIGNQSITTSSDVRIKENIVATELDAIAKINDLRVVDFTWNDPSDTSFNNKNARGKWTGLIAQEVIEHIPYVINAVRDEDTLEPIADAKSEDGTDRLWGMEYDKLVPVLIKAVQEISAKVEALENA